MKNDNGFTLVELLAIIVLLGVIVAIAAPNITKEIKRSEEKNQNILNQRIENAAHLYAAKYYANDIVDGTSISFTLNDLLDDGLITLNDDVCSDAIRDEYITIEDGEYNYSNIVSDDCYVNEE